MDPKRFVCISCVALCSVPKECNDEYVSCFKCTTNHKIIKCKKCDKNCIVGVDDLKTETCKLGCICITCKNNLSAVDGKMCCTICITKKQLSSASQFKCNVDKTVNIRGSLVDLNSSISTNLCIDISRKLDIIIEEKSKEIMECRKEIAGLRLILGEIIDMIKYHPNLGGPDVKKTGEHFDASKNENI